MSPRTMPNMSSSAPSWRRRTKTSTSARSPSRSSGSCSGPTPSNGSGPTTTPTSSARSSAGCGTKHDPPKACPDQGGNRASGSTQDPHPPDQFADHVAEREQHGSPHKGRSEEHTSELQSLRHLVCRLLLEK